MYNKIDKYELSFAVPFTNIHYRQATSETFFFFQAYFVNAKL